MRVLVLLTDAFGSRGGMAKFKRDLLIALCAHPKCQEVVALPRLIPEATGVLPVKLKYLNTGLGSKLRYMLAAVGTALSHRNCSLVICGHINLLPAAFAARRCLRGRPPIILMIYGIEAWQKHFRSNVSQLNGVISISNFTLEKFKNWSGLPQDKEHLLPCAVDLTQYGIGPKDPILLRRYQLEGHKVILTMARMKAAERYKGVDEILEVLPHLAKTIPEITYLVVGDGDDRPRLERKAGALGMEKRVIFTGWVPEEEKAAHLRLADAFVMPGWGEGFGIVYLEALACGIPVVGSKLDASCEVLRNGEWGIVVNPRNREELVAGILDALQKPRGIVPSGLEYYSFPQFQRRCHEMLDQILENASLVADSSEENALKTWN